MNCPDRDYIVRMARIWGLPSRTRPLRGHCCKLEMYVNNKEESERPLSSTLFHGFS